MSIEKQVNVFFRLKERKTTIYRELVAGMTTFATAAYAIVLVPSILAKTGMDFGAVMTATLIAAAYSSLFMGCYAHYPFALAPGIALCVYFAYSVVLARGHPWQDALGAVFLTGLVLAGLNLCRIRQLIIQVIPLSLRLATTGGLGLFLSLIGLKNVGLIPGDASEPMIGLGNLLSSSSLMSALGLIVMGILLAFGIPGAIFFGILFLWLVGLLFGLVGWQGAVSLPASLAPTVFQVNLQAIFYPSLAGAVISFVFVSLFDSSGTLVALAEEGNFLIDRKGKKSCVFPRISRALMADTTGTLLASILGTTNISVYLESAAGMSVGGRTGLTAVSTGVFFLAALFFTPFASSIPNFATTPALMIVGGMMLGRLGKIDWKDPTEWIPAFVTLIFIPLTFSIANGIAAGFIIFCAVKLFTGRANEVHWFCWVLGVFFILKFLLLPL